MDAALRLGFAADAILEGDFAMGAEQDLAEKTDHAGCFVGEAAIDEGENRFGKEAVSPIHCTN
jgi:hypothetical protein